jgi:hypothetical protein
MSDSHESPDTPTPPSTPPLSITVLTSIALVAALAASGKRSVNEYGALSTGIVAAAGLLAMGISSRR